MSFKLTQLPIAWAPNTRFKVTQWIITPEGALAQALSTHVTGASFDASLYQISAAQGVGPQGPAGAQGSQGPSGTNGAQGPQGPQGADGVPAKTGLAQRLNLWIYGDSGSKIPAQAGSKGRDWPTLLGERLRADLVTSYGVGGTDASVTGMYLSSGAIGTSGQPNPVAGSMWDGSRRGIAFLHTGNNDAAGWTDKSGTGLAWQPVATDANHQAGMTAAFRACLAILSSASRIEAENGTLTGSWSTNNNTASSGGSNRTSTTAGDTVLFPAVAVPSAGRVHLYTSTYSPETGLTPAPIDILVDGTVVKTITQQELMYRRQKTKTTPTYQDYGPAAFEIPASPGTHDITIRHAGTTGQIILVDCLFIPANSPIPIFVPHEWNAVPNAGGWTQAQIDIVTANRAVLDPLYQAIVDEFPNATYVDIPITPDGISTADGMHQNDRGHIQETIAWEAAIASFLQTYNSDNMYADLGASANPPTMNYVGSTAWGPASGVDATVNFDTMVCIFGGTVTAINIDGVATGLVSGSFILKAGHRMSIAYTTKPNFTQWVL